MRVGVIGYGKAGKAVVSVLAQDPRYSLQWVAKRTALGPRCLEGYEEVPLIGLAETCFDTWLDAHPVDAVVDFSASNAVYQYGQALCDRRIMLVSAISAYSPKDLAYLQGMGLHTRVLCSPNITLGINFLMLAAKLLRSIAPFADVEVVEQHFREKSEVSGTARKLAEALSLEDDRITSLRVGGIVGHHEVIFGFPHQTVRLIHDSIRREAFGTGAAFALQALAEAPVGCHTFEDLLMKKIRNELLAAA